MAEEKLTDFDTASTYTKIMMKLIMQELRINTKTHTYLFPNVYDSSKLQIYSDKQQPSPI